MAVLVGVRTRLARRSSVVQRLSVILEVFSTSMRRDGEMTTMGSWPGDAAVERRGFKSGEGEFY
ncbi:hypothetical protein Tdes44962_MAKER08372 [Teratosphaeria destructans]|uniref:Uncharacterized protein n=1 Tax=Teratosphaeria destructans TaxID=418781 RepID=A0A9W7SX59_9PEZI|nr:hypothetical protein Tdes44962_MAKER08372 [Teratosphaeria destructans]